MADFTFPEGFVPSLKNADFADGKDKTVVVGWKEGKILYCAKLTPAAHRRLRMEALSAVTFRNRVLKLGEHHLHLTKPNP